MMFYINSSFVLSIWMVLQITALKMHQNMAPSRVGGGEGGGGRERGPTTPQPKTTTKPPTKTTAAPTTTTAPPTTTTVGLCEDLGYQLMNGVKWMKVGSNGRLDKTQCDALCGQDGHGRPPLIKSNADMDALAEFYTATTIHNVWLGIEQLNLTTYQWADGSYLIVDTSDGSTTGFDINFQNPPQYDGNDGIFDEPCLVAYIPGQYAWDEECSFQHTNVGCACECNS